MERDNELIKFTGCPNITECRFEGRGPILQFSLNRQRPVFILMTPVRDMATLSPPYCKCRECIV